jgi:hypothetical protein
MGKERVERLVALVKKLLSPRLWVLEKAEEIICFR